MRRRRGPSGVLVVDKPPGPTSHDVVVRARRALETRSVGHAGTLDPMATGVLVLAVGQGTKLVPYLTADDKEYEAEIALGAETDTLDAEGRVVDRVPVPALDRAAVEQAAQQFLGQIRQRVPSVSAIKVDGRRLHERVRRGEQVEPPERTVVLHAIEIRAVESDRIVLRVKCGKGVYVRSLARDLARALGTLGHLAALRRTRSGAFGLEGSVSGTDLASAASGGVAARERVHGRLRALPEACRGMPRLRLSAEGREDARHGRPVRVSDLLDATGGEEAAGTPVALLAPDGQLAAIAQREGDRFRIVRGFGAD